MSESMMEIDECGTKFWRNSKGKYHRTDGPAVEYADGSKVWYVYGKLHRTDGPAIEFSNGDKEWWVQGEYLGLNDQGFWALWERLSDEDRVNPTLLSYLPGDFNV
jgi:hypothetical protein